MKRMQDILAEDRRLAILRTLEEAPERQLNEGALRHVLEHLGHQVSHDLLRTELSWLDEQGLLKQSALEVSRGDLWLAKLTAAGEDVANGRSVRPGVARPDAD